VGRVPARDVAEAGPDLRRAATQGARRIRDRDGARRISAGARRRGPRHGAVRAARRARPCPGGNGRCHQGRIGVHPRALAVAGTAAGGAGRLATREERGGQARRAPQDDRRGPARGTPGGGRGGWRSTPRHWSPRSRGGSGGGRSWLSRAIGAGAKPTRWSRSESRAGRSSTGSVSTRVRSLLRLSWRSCARIPRSPRRRSRRASASRARTRASCRTSRATRRTSSAGTPTSPHASSGYARARCSS
jgi:hypothetical protein